MRAPPATLSLLSHPPVRIHDPALPKFRADPDWAEDGRIDWYGTRDRIQLGVWRRASNGAASLHFQSIFPGRAAPVAGAGGTVGDDPPRQRRLPSSRSPRTRPRGERHKHECPACCHAGHSRRWIHPVESGVRCLRHRLARGSGHHTFAADEIQPAGHDDRRAQPGHAIGQHLPDRKVEHHHP